jgi:hypothetical protein
MFRFKIFFRNVALFIFNFFCIYTVYTYRYTIFLIYMDIDMYAYIYTVCIYIYIYTVCICMYILCIYFIFYFNLQVRNMHSVL